MSIISVCRRLLVILVFNISGEVAAQEKEIITIIGFRGTYTIADNQVYSDTAAHPAKKIALIEGNQLVCVSPAGKREVLYSVATNKVYRTGITSEPNLLFYFKDNKIYMRRKKGGFAVAGSLVDKEGSSTALLAYLEPLEYVAFLMATGEIQMQASGKGK